MTMTCPWSARVALVGVLGWCAIASAFPPAITSPKQGAVVTPPVTIELDYFDLGYCDTDGCVDVPTAFVELWDYADTDPAYLGDCDAQTECPGGMASFEVALAPGKHRVKAAADDGNFTVEFSEEVEFTVEAAATTGEPDTTGGDTTGDDTGDATTADAPTGDAPTTDDPTGDDDATGGDSDGKDGGCGCTSATGPQGGLAWLAALLLVRRRRRASAATADAARPRERSGAQR